MVNLGLQYELTDAHIREDTLKYLAFILSVDVKRLTSLSAYLNILLLKIQLQL